MLRLPEEIIDTYGLYVKKGERKVSLIGRPLPNGTVALIIYSFREGRKVQQATGVVLLQETSTEVKIENKEKIRLQKVHVDELNARAEREEVGFQPMKKTRETLADFITGMMNDEERKGSHFAGGAKALMNHVSDYERARGKKVTQLNDITPEWVKDFNDYLRFEAVDNHYKGRADAPRIKPNTQVNMLTKLSVVLNEATRQGKMQFNPVQRLSRKQRPKSENENRTFLTTDEVKRLMNTPYQPASKESGDVARAFLFSVFTGIRFSDIKNMTGKNLYKDGGRVFLDFHTQKTSVRQYLQLGQMAVRFLPENVKPNKPVFNLPSNERTNQNLKRWIAAAGIDKHITFHCARHTNATLLLNSGASLATVAFQLGHKSVKMTQIYAKITNKSQAAAVDGLDKEFDC